MQSETMDSEEPTENRAVELRFRMTTGEAFHGRLRWAFALAPMWLVMGLVTGAGLELLDQERPR